MRLKRYYTDDELVNNLYTAGKEWMTADNQQYVGLYHRYTTGETFTGAVWDAKTSVKLIPYKEVDSDVAIYQKIKNIKIRYKKPYNEIKIPTSIERQQGVMDRYFIKSVNDQNIIEINATQYHDWLSKKLDTAFYTAITLQWTIAGPINDDYTTGILTEGVITKNARQIAANIQNMPGLDQRLSNLTEFYTDTVYTVPPDINP